MGADGRADFMGVKNMKIYKAGERVNINFGASLDARMQMCAEELKIHTDIVQGTVIYQSGRHVAISTAFGQINPSIDDVSAVHNAAKRGAV